MASNASHSELDSADQAWREIDDLVDEISRLSSSELSSADFYAQLLDRIVPALAAVGGAVWTRGPDGPHHLRLEHQINLAAAQVGGDGQRHHAQLIDRVLDEGEAILVPAHSGSAGKDRATNPSEFLLVLSPWSFEGESAGVVEVFQRPGASPAAQRGYLRFLTVVCELVADFHRNQQLRGFRQREAHLGQFEQFSKQVHGSLDLKTTAYRIANEGRRLIGCDRVSVAVWRSGRCRLLAISGVDTFNRRANTVRQLERLSKVVAAADEPLWHPERSADLPHEIEGPLSAYLDESHVRALAVVPLNPGEPGPLGDGLEVVGALVFERFFGEFDETSRRSVTAACDHSALALRNALELRSVPLVRLLRAVGRARWFVRARQLPKTILALLVVGAVVVALVKVPADFNVKADGQLQPVVRRDVFAPSDGVISELRTGRSRRVRAGKVLAVLRNPELDFQFKRIWGELQTAKKRKAAAKAEQHQNPGATAEDRQRLSKLTAEEAELEELIASLKRQYQILQEQQSELHVGSPIEGEVLTWDLAQLLEARPVQCGQVLMSVADLEGPWVLELQVPDDRIAHVLDARRDLGDDLSVFFIAATDPGVTHRGQVERIAVRTEITDAQESVVLVTVKIDRDEFSKLVPGATVVAKIHCGRRPIGYVWLHDLLEAVQSRIMF